ncbi:MAG: hypothetical protein D6767_09080 [Candidatus Hydrogenedentota bacterium]|nr:MAG: hypothetical protein D6767_09080 [Candidatus Hydrogenedentota bacterium]
MLPFRNRKYVYNYRSCTRSTWTNVSPWLEFFAGPVIGFVLRLEGETGSLYISGDTVYFNALEEIAKRFQVKATILHNGAVRFPYLSGNGLYTMDAEQLLNAIRLFKARQNLIIHHSGWTHFTEKNLHKTLETESTAKIMNPGDSAYIEWDESNY